MRVEARFSNLSEKSLCNKGAIISGDSEKGAKDCKGTKSLLGLTMRRWSELRPKYSKCDGARARPAIFLSSGHLLSIFPLEGDPRKGKTGNKII